MRAFAGVQSARARFTETKQLALLKAPLVLTGTLTYQRPDRLEKHVLTPYDERIAIAGTEISVDNKSRGRTQTFLGGVESDAAGAGRKPARHAGRRPSRARAALRRCVRGHRR